MKLTRNLIYLACASLLLLGAAASGTAAASGRVHFGVGVYMGGPGYYYPPPYYYPPYYPPAYYPPPYYPPPVVTMQSPPVYVEQQQVQPAPAPQEQNYWYYCADSKAYYPYVKDCRSAWQRVTPRPAGS
jgi:hypothetical protein